MLANTRGFTLIELLITLTLLALLLTIGLPGFSKQIQHTRTKTAATELLGAVQKTRILAVSKNLRATLAPLEKWEQGWEIFIDTNSNGIRDENEIAVFQAPPLEGVRFKTNDPVKDYISFIGTGESRKAGRIDGGSIQMGTFTICPLDSGKGYQLILARSGRMRMTIAPPQECERDSPL